MPKKICHLKMMLQKAGFSWEPGKGSHTKWAHPKLGGKKLILAGNDGDHAKSYQEKQVTDAVREAKESE